MTELEKNLNFKPISDGLGFHPFSDGLPYAPKNSPDLSRGSGAVAAGPAIYARPSPHIPQQRVSQPAAQPLLVMESKTNRLAATQEQVALLEELPHDPEYTFTYLLGRTSAFLFDMVLNSMLCSFSLGWVLRGQNIQIESLLNPTVLGLIAIFLLLFNWALVTAQEIAFGSSVGKRLFGLKLEGTAGTILLRAVLFIPSSLLGFTGLLWGLFNSQKRCWHDVVVDLQPTRYSDDH